MNRALKFFLDLLLPIFCVGCKREGMHCCPGCFEKIPRLSAALPELQTQLSAPIAAPLSGALPNQSPEIFYGSPFQEHSPLADLIHRFKYDGAKEVGEILSSLMPPLSGSITPEPDALKDSVLVPVPLHKKRENWRGFNQSKILAMHLSRKWRVPVCDLLVRHRFTKPQVGLTREKRLKNLHRAFSLKNSGAPLNPFTRYFLVDDVCTTGTTMQECARVLKEHGATKVYGLVIAQAE